MHRQNLVELAMNCAWLQETSRVRTLLYILGAQEDRMECASCRLILQNVANPFADGHYAEKSGRPVFRPIHVYRNSISKPSDWSNNLLRTVLPLRAKPTGDAHKAWPSSAL